LPFNAACQIGLFYSFRNTGYVIVFQLQNKEHPQSAIHFSPPPAIRCRARKEKLLSDEFFSTFLNDAAFVKTFLISGRRASKRRKQRGEKGLSRNRWSFYFNGLQQPLIPWPY